MLKICAGAAEDWASELERHHIDELDLNDIQTWPSTAEITSCDDPLRELLHCVFPCGKLCCDDAHGGKHGHATIVELTVAHVIRQAWETKGVSVVSNLLLGVVLPEDKLQEAGNQEEEDKAIGARRGRHSTQALGHAVEAGQLDEVLDHCTKRCHHRHTAMLDLSRPKIAETCLVPNFAEAKRIEEAQRIGHPELLGGVKGRWWRRSGLLSRLRRSSLC
mmetsp:Transcript_67190/g.146488  ORF Transcript_67190/g.146488 Transcript_67190/m.146488 type:complete len:219 (+) Transcript_67190:144-800(+)